MGISQQDLDFINEACPNPARVCDLGDQDLQPPLKGKARDYWLARGVDYLSLDVVGESTYLDLNIGSARPEWGQFDVVTNCGDTEHILNQLNCFTVIHNLTKVGGVMFHSLPIAGYSAHGFFNYNLKFFLALAKANDYEVLKHHIDVVKTSINVPPHKSMPARDAGLRISLRKTSDNPFKVPLDLPEAPQEPQPLVPPALRLRRFAGRLLRRAGLVS